MRGRLVRIMFAAAAAMTVALGATAALASTTWSISPKGSFGAPLNKGTYFILKDNKTGLPFSCTVSTVKGNVPKAGHGLSGTSIATLSNISWGTSAHKCIFPVFGSKFTAMAANTPWKLNANSYDPKVDGGQTTGTITAPGTGIGVRATGSILGVSCSDTLGGTTSAPAYANVLYDNSSHLLTVTGAKNLKVLKSNCPAISKGDAYTLYICPTSQLSNCPSKVGVPVKHGYSVSTKIHLTSP